ncbi:MAG TPA: papain-like cysteine protease family protein [Candidatus Krumholzibacteria bacterium]
MRPGALILIVFLAGPVLAQRAPAGPPPDTAPVLLDVPFVAQESHLCGGACLAMLRRFWGERGIRAHDFVDDIDSPDGITTARMAEAASRAGYEVYAFDATSDLLRHHLHHGRPVIILIDAPGPRLHYIVVVGCTDRTVTYHDPAERPYVTSSLRDLEKRWRAGRHWTLLMTPRAPADASRETTTRVAGTTDHDATPWTVRAAGHFRDRRWNDAESAAQSALAANSGDAGAWQILGASRYMQSRRDDALAAWNHVDAPVVDLVQVSGLERTRYHVVADALGLDDGAMLTTDAMRLARRRLALVPSIANGRVDYRAVGTEVVDVDVAVVERSRWSPPVSGLAVAGARAVAERSVRASLTSPTGGGEVIEASYRWWENRPRVEARLSTPSVFGLQGLTRVSVAVETQTYADDAAGPAFTETTREGMIGWTQYLAPAWMIDAGAGMHHIRERGSYASLDLAFTRYLFSDRTRARAGASAWRRTDAGEPMHVRVDAGLENRIDVSPSVQLDARAGWSSVDAAAPRMLWPGAGTGEGRAALLRAHPLLDDGVIAGDAFAPSLASAGIEATRWMVARWVGAALFVDAACALPADAPRVVTDAGLGLRLRPPGQRGLFRLDFAMGVSEPAHAVSFVWQSAD